VTDDSVQNIEKGDESEVCFQMIFLILNSFFCMLNNIFSSAITDFT